MPYATQLRTDVYVGDYSGNALTVFPEEKESPFIGDGKVGSKRYFVTVKLANLKDENISVEFLIDDVSYGGEMTFQIISNALLVTIEVERLPSKALTVNVTQGENTVAVQTKSVITEKIISAKSAVSAVQKNKKDFVNALSKDGNFNAEIYVRLLCEEGKCFWYVGFCEKQNRLSSFLIDAKTGEIVAEKLSSSYPEPR